MRATGRRRLLGLLLLFGAAAAAAVGMYTLALRDDGPVGSYVALAVTLAGTAVVLLATSSQAQ